MTIRVLVVEDSRFFQRRLVEMIGKEKDMEVVAVADNGLEAIEKTKALSPDVITMDIEMPVMDGISAARRIMRECPTSILMFSVLTTDRAQETLAALDAGAIDYLPKRFEDLSQNTEIARQMICERIRSVARGERISVPAHMAVINAIGMRTTPPATTIGDRAGNKSAPRRDRELVVIGSSTGGPVALQLVLAALPADYPAPILIAQHMPGTFTPTFARRLATICAVNISEASDGEPLEPGHAYIAPGGRQTLVTRRNGRLYIQVKDAAVDDIYRPSVDQMFASVAEHCTGNVLAIVLTGMGADGREGARILKKRGALIWAQDKSSSVVFGMPAAIIDAGLADEIVPLAGIGSKLVEKN